MSSNSCWWPLIESNIENPVGSSHWYIKNCGWSCNAKHIFYSMTKNEWKKVQLAKHIIFASVCIISLYNKITY